MRPGTVKVAVRTEVRSHLWGSANGLGQFTASEVGIANVHLATRVRRVQEICASLAVATPSRRRVEQGVSYRNSAWRPPRQ